MPSGAGRSSSSTAAGTVWRDERDDGRAVTYFLKLNDVTRHLLGEVYHRIASEAFERAFGDDHPELLKLYEIDPEDE